MFEFPHEHCCRDEDCVKICQSQAGREDEEREREDEKDK